MCGWCRVHRLCAILLRRRQAGEIAKTPRPCQPVLRSVGLDAPSGEYGRIDARIACGFVFGYPEEGFPTLPLLPGTRSGIIGGALEVYGPCLHHPACSGSVRWGERGRAYPLNEGSPMKTIRLVSAPTRNRRLNEI